MLDVAEFTLKWQAQGCRGESEHEIYYDPSLQRWFKRNNFSNHGNWLEYFHRLALHNWLFPEAPLHLEGFMSVNGLFLPVVSQLHIVSQRGASEQEIDALMHNLGFEARRLTNRARKFDYLNRAIGVEANDLHDENVLISVAGDTVVIDPVPMMEQESKIRRLSALKQ